MRALLLCTLAVGCGAPAPAPAAAPYGLAVHLEFLAPAQAPGGVAISSAFLHVGGLRAVSDRSSSDPRAQLADLHLTLGDRVDATLDEAPPGLYAEADLSLGGEDQSGVELQGVWSGERVHLTLGSVAVSARCPQPARLARGQPIALTLTASLDGWLDGVDLAQASSDEDDNGIVVSDDDNALLAQAIAANVARSFQLACAPSP